MAELSAKMDQAKAKLKEKLDLLPEAQRKQIEAMVASHLGQGAARRRRKSPTRRPATPAPSARGAAEPYRIRHCRQVLVGALLRQARGPGLSRDDLSAFIAFGAFTAKMTAAVGAMHTPMAALNFDFDEQGDRIRRVSGAVGE